MKAAVVNPSYSFRQPRLANWYCDVIPEEFSVRICFNLKPHPHNSDFTGEILKGQMQTESASLLTWHAWTLLAPAWM